MNLILSLFLIGYVSTVYIPQLLVSSSSSFLNAKLIQFGPNITQKIKDLPIPDITFDDKVDGVHVKLNLTDIKQTPEIIWNTNVLKVKDDYSFSINSKNINLILTGHIEFKIGLAAKQKGTLKIDITKLQTDTDLNLTQPPCSGGIGFNIQIAYIFTHTENINIKIQGKVLDNIIINLLKNLLKSRLPTIINNVALTTINPLISNYTCNKIQENINIGNQGYIAKINTTQVPKFVDENIYFPVDLTIKNIATNKTNDEVENDNLPTENPYENKANVTGILSSNLVNTLLWVIDDSNVLSLTLTNDDLGPNPPIALNTNNLTILLPGMKKWTNKDVILMVQPSNKFSDLAARNGKIIGLISLSAKFVVNVTGDVDTSDVKECLNQQKCVIGCNLNLTLPVSAAAYIESGSILKGLIHSVGIEEVGVISSQFDIDLQVTKNILNTLVNSFRPQGNKILQNGQEIDVNKLSKHLINDVMMSIRKDHLFVGLVLPDKE